jgi:hypothetical protein
VRARLLTVRVAQDVRTRSGSTFGRRSGLVSWLRSSRLVALGWALRVLASGVLLRRHRLPLSLGSRWWWDFRWALWLERTSSALLLRYCFTPWCLRTCPGMARWFACGFGIRGMGSGRGFVARMCWCTVLSFVALSSWWVRGVRRRSSWCTSRGSLLERAGGAAGRARFRWAKSFWRGLNRLCEGRSCSV